MVLARKPSRPRTESAYSERSRFEHYAAAPRGYPGCGGAVPREVGIVALVSPAPRHDRRHRHQHNAQVAEDRHVLDVLALECQALVEVQGAATVDLHRAGQPGLDRKPEEVLGIVALDQVELLRTRPDQAHVALEHVPQLRDLVEARAAQEAAYTRDAGIVLDLEHRLGELVEGNDLLQVMLGVGDHRAELAYAERSLVV